MNENNTVDAVEQLFENWPETLIYSCLQKIMGKIYVDNAISPASAAAIIGDFCFLAGIPDRRLIVYSVKTDDSEIVSLEVDNLNTDRTKICKRNLVSEYGSQNFVIMVPQHQGWSQLIEAAYGEYARRITRYAIKKEPDVFDRGKLEKAVAALPDEYTLQFIDEPLFYLCCNQEWSKDFVSNYRDYRTYREWGIGVVALKDGIPVSGASSYASYRGGIEIEIDTREDHRRRGLAYACGARLILECLDRGLYPSWDAHNLASVALAEKLGYHFDCEYPAYEIYGCEKTTMNEKHETRCFVGLKMENDGKETVRPDGR